MPQRSESRFARLELASRRGCHIASPTVTDRALATWLDALTDSELEAIVHETAAGVQLVNAFHRSSPATTGASAPQPLSSSWRNQ
jgi:hypothetical protein